MNWTGLKRVDDFAGRAPLATRIAGHVRNFTPSGIEVRHPHRYPGNVRLGLRIRSRGTRCSASDASELSWRSAARCAERMSPASWWTAASGTADLPILLGLAAPEREVWAFDSFTGLPKPGERDSDADDGWEGTVVGSEEKLKEGFAQYAGGMDRLHVVKGWFHETFPQVVDQIDQIAVLHIDADFHDPCRLVLDTFYDKVSPGGFVAVDDLRMWEGAQIATNEFRAERGITAPIRANYYWQKPG